MQKREHDRKIGGRCEYIEPNIKDSCFLYDGDELVGVYISDVKKFKPQRTVKNDVLVYLNSKEVKKLFDYSKFDYPTTYDNFVVIKDIDKKGNPIYRNNLELVKDIFTFQCAVGCRWGDIHSMKVGMFTIQTDYFIWMMEKTKSLYSVIEGELKKKYKKKNLNAEQMKIAESLSEAIIVGCESDTWMTIAVDSLKDPSILDKINILPQIQELGAEHQLETYSAALLYHSTKYSV